jgi:enamine deaminase RidA (YjgF/YER057c/UK114 family)
VTSRRAYGCGGRRIPPGVRGSIGSRRSRPSSSRRKARSCCSIRWRPVRRSRRSGHDSSRRRRPRPFGRGRWGWDSTRPQVIEGHRRQLVRSGQDAVGADGQPQHPGDMAAQLELALDNLEAVLAAGEMTLANIARLNVYTTEVDDLFKHWGTVKDRLAHADGRFATSVVGVTRLAAPQLLVLLEATAFDRPQISQPSGHSSTSSVPSVKLARAGLTRFHERVASGRVELEPSSPASLRVRGICALAEPAKRPPTYRERGSTVNIGRTTHARALGAGRGAHSQTA